MSWLDSAFSGISDFVSENASKIIPAAIQAAPAVISALSSPNRDAGREYADAVRTSGEAQAAAIDRAAAKRAAEIEALRGGEYAQELRRQIGAGRNPYAFSQEERETVNQSGRRVPTRLRGAGRAFTRAIQETQGTAADRIADTRRQRGDRALSTLYGQDSAIAQRGIEGDYSAAGQVAGIRAGTEKDVATTTGNASLADTRNRLRQFGNIGAIVAGPLRAAAKKSVLDEDMSRYALASEQSAPYADGSYYA